MTLPVGCAAIASFTVNCNWHVSNEACAEHTILWKFLEPQPKSSVVRPEFMENVCTPATASTWVRQTMSCGRSATVTAA